MTAIAAAPEVERSARPRRRLPRQWWAGYLLILPFFVLFGAFGAYPLVFAVQLSFTDWHGSGTLHWIGLSNYAYLLTNSDFWGSLGNSAVMWLL
ncbi:MAG: sugar ABC transporter permease, partial [Microlunatus sp.]|nr:sugar ABC transporter permease [Microlunatus sp.]